MYNEDEKHSSSNLEPFIKEQVQKAVTKGLNRAIKRGYGKLKTKIVLATNNDDKAKEVKEILYGMELDIATMKEAGIMADIVENGDTFEENALIKAREVMRLIKETGEYDDFTITMADDSGLEVDYLGRKPGVFSARFMGEDTSYDIKNNYIIKELDGVADDKRTARFICAIALVYSDGREVVRTATFEGIIAREIVGENGFGYDPIFYVPEYGMTSAQLDPDKKNEISHRGKALGKIKEVLIRVAS